MSALRLPAVGPRAWAGALRQRLRADRFRTRLRRAGWRTTDGFGSVAVLEAHARRGPLPFATFEAMAHPGNPHSPAYAHECALLGTDWLAALPFPVTPVSWHDI
jgi:hypothetical protein